MEASLVQPDLWLGEVTNPVGRWVVQMAPGTNGGAPVYRTYYGNGIDTILAMHIDERDLPELEQLQLPRRTSGLEVIAGSGVIRP